MTTSANGTQAAQTWGNYYNHWKHVPDSPTWDLTRCDRMPVTSPKTIPMRGKKKEVLLEPSRTAFVIVDMQNYFLHPHKMPHHTRGREAVQPTLNLIKAFREAGVKVLWNGWGIVEADLLTMPPSLMDGFSDGKGVEMSFLGDMGSFKDDDGKVVEMGKKLERGSWNARPFGPLDEVCREGLEKGTDFWFHKNRLSGLWGGQTSLGIYLEESQTTTLFISGVNADQCVFSTYVDAFHKGYDVVYVEDCSATTTPEYGTEMVRHNADGYGFIANSEDVIEALEKQR